MKKQYVVTDENGNVSYKAEGEAAEKFGTFDAAKKRAEGLADLSPGFTICIYELTAEVRCAVSAPSTSRAKPSEHYGKYRRDDAKKRKAKAAT